MRTYEGSYKYWGMGGISYGVASDNRCSNRAYEEECGISERWAFSYIYGAGGDGGFIRERDIWIFIREEFNNGPGTDKDIRVGDTTMSQMPEYKCEGEGWQTGRGNYG